MFARLGLVVSSACLAAAPALANDHLGQEQTASSLEVRSGQFLVSNPNEYALVLKQIEAGDTIVLANGQWRDFEIVITGQGTAAAPITLMAQDAGKVVLTGQSSLRIGGEHIVVKGLVFKDGYSPRGEVVSFRRSKQDIAKHSRVTEVVIDGFSKPDRYESDYWVGMYGKNNRFDHNHLVGKTNKGVTFAIRLDSEESRENGHRVDHNYFGPRPVLGSNGGETLRIGTSKYSMFNSNSVVERNVFDRTDGEVEIISSKSGRNTFRENTFLKSRGTLTLRHGDDNVVERNVFLGGGKDHTGGIRVINRNQTVRGNYMEGMRGVDFSSALAVMNGVPNSPVNRYVEVENARIESNSILNSRRVAFNVGADEERSAAPSKTTFTNNLLSGLDGESFVESYDDISGISFAGSRVAAGKVQEQLASKMTLAGVDMARAENGLLYPTDPALAGVGAPRDLVPVTVDQVGVSWYAKPGDGDVFGASGRVIEVASGEDILAEVVMNASEGDVIALLPGEHIVNRTIPLEKSVTLKAADGVSADDVVVKFARPTLIEMREGANLQIHRLTIDGILAPDSVGNSMIRSTSYPIKSNLLIEMDGVAVRNLEVNKSFNVLSLGKSVLADRVLIKNSSFANITGSIVSAKAETEDYGQYNVEYLTIEGSAFADVGGPIADIYRGGRDESTFGPNVTIRGNQIANVGGAATNSSGASVNLHGVQIARLDGNAVVSSKPFRIVHTVGTPKTWITGNQFADTPEFLLEELIFEGPHRADRSGNVFANEDAQ